MSEALLRNLEDHDFRILLADETATVALAEDLAACLAPGDLICLSGDLGAGKSTLARALLRALADDPQLEVPSPTFTLVQTYEFERFAVSHFDLYRLEEPEELEELGLDELLETGATLVEWPEMGGDELPGKRLWISLLGAEEEDRVALLKVEGGFDRARLQRSLEIRAFLSSQGAPQAVRRYLKGDASARAYERVETAEGVRILMNSPALQSPGEETAAAAYARRAHLALDVRSFVGIDLELRRQGYLAPEIYGMDLDKGFLLLQDLGQEGVLDVDGAVIPERYRAAALLLADMHARSWPTSVPLPLGGGHDLPLFSREALLSETGLFLEWYLPFSGVVGVTDALREEFSALWSAAFDAVSTAEAGWVLRDFHSPNLLWQADRAGHRRIGLIDFQDAVIGPTAYDLGSLLFDARVEVPQMLEQELLEAYLETRLVHDGSFDASAFKAAYAVFSAQRITKILGIFVRLARRDGKPAYLSHLPRMNAYLDRALKDPVLSDLKLWFDTHRPS